MTACPIPRLVVRRTAPLATLAVLACLGRTPSGHATILQVNGTLALGDPNWTVSGTIDTSGYGTNQLDVYMPAVSTWTSPIHAAFAVTRQLLWNGARRLEGAPNYWDAWGGNYRGWFQDVPGPGFYACFDVQTTGSDMTYSVPPWLASSCTTRDDIVGLRSWDVEFQEYDECDTACFGAAVFDLASGGTEEVWTSDLVCRHGSPPDPYSPFVGFGGLYETTFTEIAPDTWRFTWCAWMTPEPSTLSGGLLATALLLRQRRATIQLHQLG